MRCPNCGAELRFETYHNMRPGNFPPQVCYFCKNGDFITDSTYPTRAISEIEGAYKWNAERRVAMLGDE